MKQEGPKRSKAAKPKKGVARKKSKTPETPPSLEPILAGFALGAELTPQREAQEMVYTAWETSSHRKRAELARKALKLWPDCADAYGVLAQGPRVTLAERIKLYRRAVEGAERSLGKKCFKQNVGYFWGLLETRPYMRALASLAQSLWENGEYVEAIDLYWELLRLNPSDNQGNRYFLVTWLIAVGRDSEAEKLLAQFDGDTMAIWLYSRALLDFRKHGDAPRALAALRLAIATNPHVPQLLTGRKKLPETLPGYYEMGHISEAVICVLHSGIAWLATPGALDWLRRHAA
ncbi:MAG: hypothetical protein AAB353_08890 [Candidatus Hydrogenedentota bacterium]